MNMKRWKVLHKLSICLLGVGMLIHPLQAADISIEKVYDSKIRAIQGLSNTYVVANYICDFNGDGVKDLLVSTWEHNNAVHQTDKRVNNTIYTYKNGEVCKLNDKIQAIVDGTMYFPDTRISIAKKGNQTMIKFDGVENQGWGVHTRTTIYYILDKNNNLNGYLKRYSYDDSAGDNKVGQKISYFKNGKNITQDQYNAEKNAFNSEEILYRTSSVVPFITGKADKYNSTKEGGDFESPHMELSYEEEIRSEDNWGL